ncbi:MAG: hypothetical protein IGS50_14070 [Synechococcales cyanobacterium C42_A2020_086]|jgi:lysophospholipase L1-like esterase|nr:hypothetical protein [Synechococcales cyanobacterium C42_A2020_086]
MRNRHLRSITHFFRFSPVLLHLRLLPSWLRLLFVANGLLSLGLLGLLLLRQAQPAPSASAHPPASDLPTPLASTAVTLPQTQAGTRRQLTYEAWVNQLQQEARVIAAQSPERLTVLAGDSISLWFPKELLPIERTWLNQGISGETSGGLLKRLDAFADTDPETIFVMIGINDLLRGISEQTVLDNQRQIIRDLAATHPDAQIVVQSILPHAEESTWEGRDRLLTLPNQQIRDLNRQLETIAREEGAYFLDLYPLFANAAGDLRPELSTDGLHLNAQGYQTWSIALQVFSREVLEPKQDDE